MARARIRLQISPGASRVLSDGVSRSMIARANARTEARVKGNIRAAGRVDTGAMINSVTSDIRPRGRIVTGRVYSTARHTIFQEAGTRAHGPRSAPFMVFQIRGRGPVIFAKWVRGVTAGRFFERAWSALSQRDFMP